MNQTPQLPPLIASLLKPQAYPHAVGHCEVIETHISWVILAGEFAYKLKKPIDLGFLDYSTLNRRHNFCEEEVRLNARLAPEIYLECVAISGPQGSPVVGARENVIEYAVKMRRFAQEAQLDRLLSRGQLHETHIDAFAEMTARFHQQIPVASVESEYGEPSQVWQPMAENFVQIREHLTDAKWEEALQRLEQWSRETFARQEERIRQRKHDGFIRECHGDMHLRNLIWLEGKAMAFDGIEFNPSLRWIDVISEVAFMVMDLQARGEAPLAQRFLNRYLEISGDYESLALMPLYLVYRALVRAKVAAIRSGQPGLDAAAREGALGEFAHYLELAQGYGASGQQAVLIARGVSASGKTTLTGPLVQRLGAIRLRSDVERKRLFGLSADESGKAAPGEGIYTNEASERTYDRLAQLSGEILQAGYSVIIDAACLRRRQRERFERLAREQGLPCLLLEFHATPEVLRQRMAGRKGGASDADLAVLEQQLKQWEPPGPDEQPFTLQVDTEALPGVDALAERVVERLQAQI